MRIYMHERGKWSDRGADSYQADVILFPDGHKPVILQGSTWPNPISPNEPYPEMNEAYGCVQVGKYWWEFGEDAHDGTPALNLARNGPVPALAPNPSHDGLMYVDHADVHRGDHEEWRGSAACPTIFPPDYGDFLHWVRQGESGIFVLEREQNLIQ